ncbi:tyrosinase family oxidase copper chaperone [Streptomyces sp. ITFR-16]|uniref:tyrosinase family oxidase copper chaperone n=1 Tax=Streptomyces sp. ITFR-16 TaxID=3075198 RepID=UPI00288B1054|nr:tyrosinase family oxidase copper chaperone [Streptomyces sp. ITFR-16]WNI26727.1 tyrosinase family oxidase copper chaperone [Streptomyces sp. ITFR-16]
MKTPTSLAREDALLPGPPAPVPQASSPRSAVWSRRSAGLVLLGTAAAGVSVFAMGQHRSEEPGDPSPGAMPETFEEMFQGRHITGSAVAAVADGARSWQVSIDGRALHLMRRADGTYLSMVDHYTAYPTPLDAARGAAAELRGRQLRVHEGGPGTGRKARG